MVIYPVERIEYVRPAELRGVELMRVDNVARRWRVFHETYTVCTVLDAPGEAELRYRGRLYRAGRGAVLLMEPGELHANTRITPPGSFRSLFIAPWIIEQAAAELGLERSQLHWSSLSVGDPQLFAAFARLHAGLEGDAGVLERECRFAAALRLLLARCTGVDLRAEQARYSRLQRCRQFILEHYSRAVTLDELAALSALSRFHFARAFTRTFGAAPHAYQIQVRIEKARKLLAQGMSQASIAVETGFADQSHFSHHFRKVTGVTPARYAARGLLH